MYAFVSHTSACEAIRKFSGKEKPWPDQPRRLPRHGGCVSTQRAFAALEAREDLSGLGIETRPVDLIVCDAAARSRGRSAHFHVWSRDLPARSLVRASDNVLICGPELAIIQLCGTNVKLEPLLDDFAAAVRAEIDLIASLGLDDEPVLEVPLYWERIRSLVCAAVIACEFAGTYRLDSGGKKTRYNRRKLMTCSSLRAMARSLGTRSMERRAERAADIAFDGSRSPMETALALMLTLPVAYGGFGLPRPKLNANISVAEWRGDVSDRDTVCVDMWWKDKRVAVEYDSFEFHSRHNEAQLTTDAIRANILTALGCASFRVTPRVIRSLEGVRTLAAQIARRLGIALVEPTAIEAKRRTSLYTELMPRRNI